MNSQIIGFVSAKNIAMAFGLLVVLSVAFIAPTTVFAFDDGYSMEPSESYSYGYDNWSYDMGCSDCSDWASSLDYGGYYDTGCYDSCGGYDYGCCYDYSYDSCDYCYDYDYGTSDSYSYGGGTSYFSSPSYYSSPSYSSGRSYAPAPTPIYTSPSYSNGGTTVVNNIDNSINDSFNTYNVNSHNTGSFNAITVSSGVPASTAVASVDVSPTTVSVTALASSPSYYSQSNYYSQSYYQTAPSCTISASNYGYGGAVTLTWTSYNATSATISPYVGSVFTNGSRVVYPTAGQTYTMTVYGAGGSGTCQTYVQYQPVYTPPVYTPPVFTPIAAPYVSLSQIPYTGFDFGPVGNALYWMSLAAVAFAGAYLVVYYRGGAFTFATQFLGRTPSRSPIRVMLPVAKTEARVEKKETVSGHGTTDRMSFMSVGGAPRIVISRS